MRRHHAILSHGRNFQAARRRNAHASSITELIADNADARAAWRLRCEATRGRREMAVGFFFFMMVAASAGAFTGGTPGACRTKHARP
jgi:hypothetical protein